MKALSITLSVLVLLMSAGCAQRSSTAMGASAAPASGPRLICRDGYWTGPGGSCGDHGGTERVMSSEMK